MSQTPPEASWMIQDLDMMYPPHDRPPAFQIKNEATQDACAYAPSESQLQPSGTSAAPYPAGQYGGGVEQSGYSGGEWPADLENISLDGDLPTEDASPLGLENYVTKFIFVDPGTQSPKPEASFCAAVAACQGSPPASGGYPAPVQGYDDDRHQGSLYYNQTPLVAMETLQPEVTPVADVSDGHSDERGQPRRGRPRAEWRSTKRGPGRPRSKPGRKPTLGVVKTEIGDNEENMYPDILEEKRERRREQNRRAARKLREKKKVHVEHMKQNYEHILSENRRLSSEIDSLKRIISQLESAKNNHVCMCTSYTPSPPSSVTSQPVSSSYVSGSDSRGSFTDAGAASIASSMTSSRNPLDDFV